MNTEDERTTQPLILSHYNVDEWRQEQRAHGKPPWETAAFPAIPDDDPEPKLRIVALIPAHNEQEGIGNTIQSLLDQTRELDEIIVISDNSDDDTVKIASQFPVRVIETVGNTHRKSGALNLAWNTYCQNADIIVCADGDTQMPPTAVADWETEFQANENLGGSSSQPVMTGHGYLPRLQRYEFSKSVTQSLSRGWCRVVSGTGCAFRNTALHEAARLPNQAGPWTYESVVEDYHLTYRLRQAGWKCEMSPTVYCYTGSMKNLKSLWYQRIKWTAGTAGDLLVFGCNRLNYREWMQQGFLLLNLAFWAIWLAMDGTELLTDGLRIDWRWQIIAVLFAAMEFTHVQRMRSPNWSRDWLDIILATFLIHMFIYNILSMAWGLTSWYKVLISKMGDLWAPQYRAEGMNADDMKIGVGS
jgi:poly-beta-1,6-N-acetyl-D-glucosamine synthase